VVRFERAFSAFFGQPCSICEYVSVEIVDRDLDRLLPTSLRALMLATSEFIFLAATAYTAFCGDLRLRFQMRAFVLGKVTSTRSGQAAFWTLA
jgi:hypothetical protein